MSIGIVASAHVPFGWTDLTLSNSWANTLGNWPTSGYDGSGVVSLRGLVDSGTTTAGTVMATGAPTPASDLMRQVVRYDAGTAYALGRVDVDTSGQVVARSNVSATFTHLPSLYLDATVTPTAPTLGNSWVDYGGGYAGAGYYRDGDGTVYLQGVIKSGTTTSGTVLFTLPTGYRPAARLLFHVISNDGSARIDVFSNGEVQVRAGASSTYLCLDGISFPTASLTGASLSSFWSNYGGDYQTAGYYQDSGGNVHLSGLIKSGTTTFGATILTLPVGLRPSGGRQLFVTMSNVNVFAAVYCDTDGTVRVGYVANNGFLSLDGIVFSTT